MSIHTTPRPPAAPSYEPPAARTSAAPSSQALIAEAIGCIVHGRPLPEPLRPRPFSAPRPATVQEGITRILRS